MDSTSNEPEWTPQFADVRRLLEQVLRGMAQEWLLTAELLARDAE